MMKGFEMCGSHFFRFSCSEGRLGSNLNLFSIVIKKQLATVPKWLSMVLWLLDVSRHPQISQMCQAQLWPCSTPTIGVSKKIMRAELIFTEGGGQDGHQKHRRSRA